MDLQNRGVPVVFVTQSPTRRQSLELLTPVATRPTLLIHETHQ
jgi:hypothetical protein